jgi:hypothetical protein
LVEHLTQKQVEEYCRQQLRVSELLAVSDHMGECATCRQRIESALSCDTALLSLRVEVFDEAAVLSTLTGGRAHLTEEQAGLFVDRRLSSQELQVVTDHLSNCAQCALVVDDLHAFKNQLGPSLEHEYHPADAPSERSEGWWRRAFLSLPALFQAPAVPAFGAVMAILLVALSGLLIWRVLRVREPVQEVAVTSPTPVPTTNAPQVSPTTEPTSQPTPEPTPAQAVAQLNDGGGQLALNQNGELSGAESLPPAYRKMVKEALTSPRIERSSELKGLSRPPSALKGEGKEDGNFSVIEPAGKVILTDRPAFRWSSLEGASAYVVEVYDEQFSLVASSPQVKGNSWGPQQPLPRGRLYAWQVKAIKDGQEFTSPRPPAPQARFRILDGAKAVELMRARRAYPSSHLTLGLLYSEAGLLDEAEREFRLLQKANPGSEVARSLLRQVQALRRQTQ